MIQGELLCWRRRLFSFSSHNATVRKRSYQTSSMGLPTWNTTVYCSSWYLFNVKSRRYCSLEQKIFCNFNRSSRTNGKSFIRKVKLNPQSCSVCNHYAQHAANLFSDRWRTSVLRVQIWSKSGKNLRVRTLRHQCDVSVAEIPSTFTLHQTSWPSG